MTDATPPAAWTDYPSGHDLRPCAVCDNSTRSHAVYLTDTGEKFVPGDEDDHDLLLPVCHSCYRDVDGDAWGVAATQNEKRSPIVEGAGLTPGLLSEFVDAADAPGEERVKAFSQPRLRELVTGLEPGAVIETNETDRWVCLPVNEETQQALGHLVHFALIQAEDRDGPTQSGALIDSEHQPPKLYVARYRDDTDGLEFETVDALEYQGKRDVDLDSLDLEF